MAKAKGPGRPSLYKEEYCEMLVEHCAKGLSFESFAGVVKVNRDTLYEWEKKHIQFSDAKKRAEAVCRLFWEEAGIKGLWGSKDRMFNATVWIFNMKNRFGWKDVKDVEVSSGDKKRLVIHMAKASKEDE